MRLIRNGMVDETFTLNEWHRTQMRIRLGMQMLTAIILTAMEDILSERNINMEQLHRDTTKLSLRNRKVRLCKSLFEVEARPLNLICHCTHIYNSTSLFTCTLMEELEVNRQ